MTNTIQETETKYIVKIPGTVSFAEVYKEEFEGKGFIGLNGYSAHRLIIANCLEKDFQKELTLYSSKDSAKRQLQYAIKQKEEGLQGYLHNFPNMVNSPRHKGLVLELELLKKMKIYEVSINKVSCYNLKGE